MSDQVMSVAHNSSMHTDLLVVREQFWENAKTAFRKAIELKPQRERSRSWTSGS